MAETLTPNYNWVKPDIGGDASSWGYVLNTTLDAIDSVAFANSGCLKLTGGTVTGATSFTAGMTATNGYAVSQASGSGNASFVMANNAGAAMGFLYWNPANQVALFNQTGGGYLIINADGSISTSGAFYTGALAAADITCSSFSCSGAGSFSGQLNTVGAIHSGGSLSGTGLVSRPGVSGTSDFGHQYNFNWDGARNNLWLDGSNWGQVQTNSDYRMKKDIQLLGSTWDRVKALKPISYTHKDWTPPASVEHQKKTGGALIRSDNAERWGFLAHELQETLVESAANGVKDDPVAVQSPNPFTVIAALTRALQEAMARIEALEAAR